MGHRTRTDICMNTMRPGGAGAGSYRKLALAAALAAALLPYGVLPSQPQLAGWGCRCARRGRLVLRGGAGGSSSSPDSLSQLEEGEHWHSDFSSDELDHETGIKGAVKPNTTELLRLEDYSSEIDEWTRPDPELYPQAEASRQKYLAERGSLDPSFKASTLHDESWDEVLEKSRADSCARGFSGRDRKRLFIARLLLD